VRWRGASVLVTAPVFKPTGRGKSTPGARTIGALNYQHWLRSRWPYRTTADIIPRNRSRAGVDRITYLAPDDKTSEAGRVMEDRKKAGYFENMFTEEVLAPTALPAPRISPVDILLRFNTCGAGYANPRLSGGSLRFKIADGVTSQIEACFPERLADITGGGQQDQLPANLTDGSQARKEQGITIDVPPARHHQDAAAEVHHRGCTPATSTPQDAQHGDGRPARQPSIVPVDARVWAYRAEPLGTPPSPAAVAACIP
jgi:hypothetical protein